MYLSLITFHYSKSLVDGFLAKTFIFNNSLINEGLLVFVLMLFVCSECNTDH